jgi:hypothetical protein
MLFVVFDEPSSIDVLVFVVGFKFVYRNSLSETQENHRMFTKCVYELWYHVDTSVLAEHAAFML